MDPNFEKKMPITHTVSVILKNNGKRALIGNCQFIALI